jgi:hypothetical protein
MAKKTDKKAEEPKKALVPEPGQTRAHMLAARLRDTNPDVGTAADSVNKWSYIDFCDPKKNGRPCLALEWLFGARGLLVGRLLNLIATYSKGKSSFMYLMYACAQRMLNGAWCCHEESEGAPAPADFIASYGCNPDDLVIAGKTSLEETFEWVDETEAMIRGPWGVGEIDPETGKKKASKFVDPFDPLMERPIILGVDSLSSLGLLNKVNVDVADMSKTAQPGAHAKAIREYLRDHVGRFNQRKLLLMLSSHETKKIDMGGKFGGGKNKSQSDVTSIAREAVGIQATYEVTITSKTWRDKDPPYTKYGDIIAMYTEKNKVSPRYRSLDMYLRPGKGYDLTMTDVTWLAKDPESPFVHPEMTPTFGTIATRAGTVKCPLLQEKAFETYDDFLDALYARTDILQGMREWLRIRGFGFKFETDYKLEFEDDDEAAPVETAEATPEPEA